MLTIMPQINAIDNAVSVIRNCEAAHIEYPVSVPPVSSLERKGRMTTTTATRRYRALSDTFMNSNFFSQSMN